MSLTLKWKRKLLTGTSTIYSGDTTIGYLTRKGWSRSKVGTLNGRTYHFILRGFFKPTIDVIDEQGDSKIGEITFKAISTKAQFEYLGEIFDFKYTNIWKSKWQFTKGTSLNLSSKCSNGTGILRMEHQDDILILAGLFISSYYLEATGAG